ncbi:pendrin-like [Lethenteron reissneri]|uniref:pendrin-like n=1 Tax=Lethenteron reissneri TaxID=7753 RepID=UPI002AB5F3C5|nr:pendrin-like [Lethenteron reissneri]
MERNRDILAIAGGLEKKPRGLVAATTAIAGGLFPVVSLMVGTVTVRLVPDDGGAVALEAGNETLGNATVATPSDVDARRVAVAASVTCLVGIIQLCLGALRVGFVSIFLSSPLVSGFMTAAAFHVLVSQLKYLFGLSVPSYSGPFASIYAIIEVFSRLPQSNVADVVTSIICIVVAVLAKEINQRFARRLPVPIPVELLVTVVATAVSYGADLEGRFGVDVVRDIPKGLAPPVIPDVSLFPEIIGDAFAIAIVAFVVPLSLSKIFAQKHGYAIDSNQELLAFGVSNIFGSFFQTVVVSTSLSRSLIQESTGGKTQVAALLSSIIVLIVILALGFLLEPLQTAVLASLVVVNLKGMFTQVKEVPRLWRTDRIDCLLWVVSCVMSILLGLDLGLAVALAFEILTTVAHSLFPACVPLGNIPDTEIYKRVGVFKQAAETPGVKVVRCPAPLYFGNIEYFREKLMAILQFDPARVARKRDKALKKLKKRLSREAALPINAGAQNEAFSASDQSETSDESGDDTAVGAGVEEVKATRGARGAHEVVATVETKWAPPTKRELAGGTLGPDGEGGGAGPWRQAWLAVELEGVPRVTVDTVILDFSSVTYLDTVAVNTLTTMTGDYQNVGVSFLFAGCDDAVLARLERAGFFAGAVARSSFFPTTRDAALWHAAHAAPPVSLAPRASPRASVSPLCEFGLTAATFSGSVSTVTSRPKRQRGCFKKGSLARGSASSSPSGLPPTFLRSPIDV